MKLFPFASRPLVGALLIGIVPGVAAAADQGASDQDIVVSANRVETDAAKVGSSVTVITAKDIEQVQARTALDVLEEVPGVTISQSGGMGGGAAVRIRGAEGYHTKVLIDGVDVGDSSGSQNTFDFAHLLASDIERIEVLRGAQSLLYGSDAIGGVVSITTRKGKGTPKTSIMAEGGSLHTYTGALNSAGEIGRFNYAIGVTHFETDGISAADTRRGANERDPYDNQTVNAKLGAQILDNWSVEASGRFVRSKNWMDGWGWTSFTDDIGWTRTMQRSGRLATDFSVLNGKFSNHFAYGVSETERDNDNGLLAWGSRRDYFNGETHKAEYQGTARLSENHTLVFGAERSKSSAETLNIDKSVTNNGYFLDYQLSPLEALSLTVGGRLDDHQTFGTHATWRTTAAYLIDATETRLHASAGTGFRAPSLYELYDPTYGKATLQPEKSRSWDAGVEQSFWQGKASVDVTAFVTRIGPKIDYDFSTSKYVNLNSTRAQGVETSAKVKVTDDLRLRGTYTFTDSRNNQTGSILTRRPKHTGSVGATWEPIQHLALDTSVKGVGSQKDGRFLGGYALVDTRVSYDVTESVQVFGRVDNLLDKKYEEIDGYGTLGRMAYVGVKATF